MAEANLSGFPWWTKKFSAVETLVLLAVEAFGPMQTDDITDHFLLYAYKPPAVKKALAYLTSRGLLSCSAPEVAKTCPEHTDRPTYRRGVCRECYGDGKGEDHRAQHTYTIAVPGAGFGKRREDAEA